jgi:hypothetical protein
MPQKLTAKLIRLTDDDLAALDRIRAALTAVPGAIGQVSETGAIREAIRQYDQSLAKPARTAGR